MTEFSPSHKQNLRQLLGRFWTIPNMLSLMRMVLVGPIAYLILVDGSLALLFALVLLAVVSDWFDGRIARWSGTVSEWGKVLDPLADKVAAAVVVLALVARGSLPLWLLLLIVVRDVLIVIGGAVLARRTGHVVMSIMAGKAAVTVLALAILAALLRADEPILTILIIATAVMMIYSFFVYCVRFIRIYRYGRLPVPVDHAVDPDIHARMRNK